MVRLAEVRPFDDLRDRRRLVEAYLSQFLKQLDERHLEDAQRRYVRAEGDPAGRSVRAWHTLLADYFEKTSLDTRKADELPWHLVRAERWDRLTDCLADLDMFLTFYTRMVRFDLMGYWQHLAGIHEMAAAYREALRGYEARGGAGRDLAHRLNEAALFLDECGRSGFRWRSCR